MLAAWDVRDPDWWPASETRRTWLTRHGIPITDTYRVEFHLIDGPVARIYTYHRSEAGHRHWSPQHNPATCGPHHTCGPCKLEPFDLPLSELP